MDEVPHDLPKGVMFLVRGEIPTASVECPGTMIEAVAYVGVGGSHKFHLTFHAGTSQDNRALVWLDGVGKSPIEYVSVSLICTSDPHYQRKLVQAVRRIRAVFPNPEICVAYFGEGAPPIGGLRYEVYPRRSFHMSFARNQSLSLCTGSHVLVTDLDCMLTERNLAYLFDVWRTAPHNGVLNIKRPKPPYPGNTLTFGELEKVRNNGFDERFRMFWFEDTEYLMNFSRVGVVPWTVFLDFDYEDHPRGHTRSHSPNKALFARILKQGHR